MKEKETITAYRKTKKYEKTKGSLYNSWRSKVHTERSWIVSEKLSLVMMKIEKIKLRIGKP